MQKRTCNYLSKKIECEMGFVNCPSCMRSVSDAVDPCPYCGSPLPKPSAAALAPAAPVPLASTNEASAEPPFFAVSLLKLTVMSLCTLGIYEIYWFYRNWKRIESRGRQKIMPFWRAVFTVLFCYPCFAKIREYGASRGIFPVPPFVVLTVFYILTTISWKLPDPFWLISLFTVFFLLPIQSYVNRINAAESPGHDPNSRFTAWNWAATVFGGIFFILAIVAAFLPNE